jgi:flavin reductase (DIM6/NTAB) family NADH-FMN oxidoreductase RutF
MSKEAALQFRSLMARFVTGVTVIAVPNAEKPGAVIGMTANAVSAVSTTRPPVAGASMKSSAPGIARTAP